MNLWARDEHDVPLLMAESGPAGRVLHVIVPEPKGEIGGADIHVLELAVAQKSRSRLQPLVLITQNEEYAERLRAEAIPCLPGHISKTYLALIRMLAAVPGRQHISLIHSHGYDANYLVYLLRRLFPHTWGRLPLVMTCHGWVEDSLYHKLKTWAEFVTYRMARALLVCNPKSLDRLGKLKGRLHVVYIPNGIRLPASNGGPNGETQFRERLGLPETDQLVAAVGRLAPEKRLDVYLAACKEIAGAMAGVHFLVVGAGPEREKLEALAQAYGLAGKVTFTGLITHMEAVYRELSLLLLSSDTEGTPRVVLEAMAHSVPVVATRVGGVEHLVVHGENGLLVERSDFKGLAESALALLRNTARRRAWGAEGRNRVCEHFSIWEMQERVENVYERVLGQDLGAQ